MICLRLMANESTTNQATTPRPPEMGSAIFRFRRKQLQVRRLGVVCSGSSRNARSLPTLRSRASCVRADLPRCTAWILVTAAVSLTLWPAPMTQNRGRSLPGKTTEEGGGLCGVGCLCLPLCLLLVRGAPVEAPSIMFGNSGLTPSISEFTHACGSRRRSPRVP